MIDTAAVVATSYETGRSVVFHDGPSARGATMARRSTTRRRV